MFYNVLTRVFPIRVWLVLLLGTCFVLLLLNAGSYGATETSDARYAEIAREMYHSGDYIHPSLLNIHHYHKPPLTYHITALGYFIWGVNTFGARFFLQLAIIIQALLVFLLGKELYNHNKTSLLATIIYLGFPIVLASSRNLTTDAYLNTFVLLSLWAWAKYRKGKGYSFLYLYTFSLALGFLTKGPVVFIVPLIFTIFYTRLEKGNTSWSIHHIGAWMIFLVIASSWFIILISENKNFVDYFLLKHTVKRFATNTFDRSKPFWYFIVFGIVAGFPWTISSLVLLFRKRTRMSAKGINFVIVATIGISILFFSLSSSKLILYILPIYPLFALLSANLLQKTGDGKIIKRLNNYILIFSFLISIAILLTPLFADKIEVPGTVMIITIIALGISVIVTYSKRISPLWKSSIVMLALSMSLIQANNELTSSNPDEFETPDKIVEYINANNLERRNVYVYNSFLPSIAFALDKPIVSLNDGARHLKRDVQFEQNDSWKQFLVNLTVQQEFDSLKSRMSSSKSILISHKRPVPEKRSSLLNYFSNQKYVGNWYIYY